MRRDVRGRRGRARGMQAPYGGEQGPGRDFIVDISPLVGFAVKGSNRFRVDSGCGCKMLNRSASQKVVGTKTSDDGGQRQSNLGLQKFERRSGWSCFFRWSLGCHDSIIKGDLRSRPTIPLVLPTLETMVHHA